MLSTVAVVRDRPRAAARAVAFAAPAVALAGLLFAVLVTERVPRDHLVALELPGPWADGVAGLALACAGSVVLRNRRHILGWLLVAFGLWWSLNGMSAAWLALATATEPALPGAELAFWVFMRLGAALLLILPLILLLYPEGQLPTGRWRAPAMASLIATALLPAFLLVIPSDVAEMESTDAPLPPSVVALDLDPLTLPLPDEAWHVVLRAAYLLVPLSLVLPFLVVLAGHRAANGTDRLRMRWLLWAGMVDVLVMLAFAVLPDGVGSYGLTVAVAVTAGAVAIGLVCPDVVDVDRLLDSTIVYGLLVVVSYLLDLALLGLASSVLGAHLSGMEALVLAVFVVSLVYAPLRHRLWRLARRRARGERDDPYGVVSRLAVRLETSDTPAAQLLEIARAVRRAFRTSYAAVEVLQDDGGHMRVEEGTAPEETDAMPIAYRGELIGWLHLPRAPRQRLRSADEALLADMVRQAAAAARAAQLSDELQSSRERIVTVVEEERRRLRNELHDGLGPTLAAIASRIDTARITGRRSPEEADRILAAARAEITDVIAEVRRLVHGLRPPALDDVGLAGAARQLVDRLRSPRLSLSLEISPELPHLAAAVEVAAYRIVAEALTNVVRHAHAQHATVTITEVGGDLVVEVSDDGVGIDSSSLAGVGLTSMRERARELGGRCRVEPTAVGGTRVTARLPLRPPGRSPSESTARDQSAAPAVAAEGAPR
ncbi:MAG TPA: sensor histidine kinase [Nocardioides sp.]|nr:sensor histidine kinase [Nocardioides sp.]